MIKIGAIEPNSIQMSKGDYFRYNMRLVYNGEPFALEEGDELLFTVKRQPVESSIILLQKCFTQPHTDVFTLEITQSDVSGMPCGRYCYDISLKKQGIEGYITPCRPIAFQLWEAVR